MPSIDNLMSRHITTITPSQSLAEAKKLMSERNVRHLPVMADGRLQGMLSERELDLVATIGDRTSDELKVSLAMQANVLQVDPSDELAEVARLMASSKCGSAVVIDGEEVVGIFTTIDALEALVEYAAP